MIATIANAQSEVRFEIIDQRVIPSPDLRRRDKEDVSLVVQVQGGPRLLIRLPAETYTQDALKAEVLSQINTREKRVERQVLTIQRTEPALVPEPQSASGVWPALTLITVALLAIALCIIVWRLRRTYTSRQ